MIRMFSLSTPWTRSLCGDGHARAGGEVLFAAPDRPDNSRQLVRDGDRRFVVAAPGRDGDRPVRIVLNHVGGPIGIGAYSGKRNEVLSRWAASIKALAAHQNVYVKVGGLGQRINGFGLNEQTEPPSSEMLAATFRPYVETCIDAFGTSRSMFESNFPVDKVAYSYPVFWNACKLLARGVSHAEKGDLFAGTAARFYRLNAIG